MNKAKFSILLLVSAFFIQGCSSPNSTTTKTTRDESQPALQRCINQATILMKMNKKYEKQYSELYKLINETKFYASIANDTAGTVNATVAPLLEYKVNNTCNTISQLLIQEFKNKVEQEGMLLGNI